MTEITMRLRITIIGLLLAAGAIPAQKTRASVLSEKINRVLSAPAIRETEIGIQVVRLSDGVELFSLNPDKPLIPASNMKLLTTACALARLKPEYRFKTTVYGDTPLLQGKIKGNLYLQGGGDPFLVQEEMWRLANRLHGLGLREITGDIVADDSFFDARRRGEDWGKTSRWYHAEISALSFNFNTVAVHVKGAARPGISPVAWTDPPSSGYIELQNRARTVDRGKIAVQVERLDGKKKDIIRVSGSLPVTEEKTAYRAVRDATRYTAVSFADFLKRENIAIGGKIKTGTVPRQAALVCLWESRPLGQIVTGLNRFSNNFIAECILKTMGAEIGGKPGTTEKGLEVVREFLREAGIKETDKSSLVLADGSGLSRRNRLTARALVQVLDFMYGKFEYRPEFIHSLATYGVNGTLEKRGTNRSVRAKTGSIEGVSSLSGYIGKGRETLAFSILVNNMGEKTAAVEAMQDAVCHILGENL
jgi:D-alanyl-D-alanine carboxypeptidase/D-alanyl-D-alanine-endopeptidase (penicillin-binding protein 4)